MRPLIVCLGVLVVAVLSACGAEPETETETETASESPSPLPCPSSAEPPDDASSSSRCVSGAGGQSAGGSAAVGGGGPNGSITRRWSESVTQIGGGTSSVITQQYLAIVRASLSKVEGAWTISGSASISSAYTSDWKSNQASALGPCNVHYTDNASASDTVDVEGGLEARDSFYQFYVSIPGADGSNATVRDDSGCNGPNNQETTPWSAAPITASGSGDMTDARTISGSSSTPRQNGEDTLTWSFTLPE